MAESARLSASQIQRWNIWRSIRILCANLGVANGDYSSCNLWQSTVDPKMSTQTFAADIAAFVKKANGNAERVVKKIVFDLGTKIVMRSPVGDGLLWKSPPPPGYVGGRFRANWQYGFGSIPSGDLPDIDKSGGASTLRIAAGIKSVPAAGIHYLVNNLPYAKRLEDGWSTQAPAGMVGLTAVEFQQLARDAAAEISK